MLDEHFELHESTIGVDINGNGTTTDVFPDFPVYLITDDAVGHPLEELIGEY
jgi:hypothetical protein